MLAYMHACAFALLAMHASWVRPNPGLHQTWKLFKLKNQPSDSMVYDLGPLYQACFFIPELGMNQAMASLRPLSPIHINIILFTSILYSRFSLISISASLLPYAKCYPLLVSL